MVVRSRVTWCPVVDTLVGTSPRSIDHQAFLTTDKGRLPLRVCSSPQRSTTTTKATTPSPSTNTFGHFKSIVLISITVLLVALTALISMGAFQERRVFEALLYQPYAVRTKGQWYRLLTHAFIHADWSHLLVNMFVLYMFGRNVEMLFALVTPLPTILAYLALYIGGILFAALPGLAKRSADPGYRSVGASGAVSAVLFAQILLLPTREVSILFVPIAMPAWVFGILYLVYSWYMDKRGGDHVAHDAHFYGAVFGILFTTALRPDLLYHLGSFQRSLGY